MGAPAAAKPGAASAMQASVSRRSRRRTGGFAAWWRPHLVRRGAPRSSAGARSLSTFRRVTSAGELQRLELAVGRVLDATQQPGARGPSLLVTVDLGPRGRREGTLALPAARREEVIGRQVVCLLDPDELL